jgi:hypothetical protein
MSFWDKLKRKINPPVVKKAEFKPKALSDEFVQEYIKIAAALEVSMAEAVEQIKKLDNAIGNNSTSI